MQRKLLEKSEITAFQTPLGLYQFKVMPFRLLNASTSFTRLMRKLIQVLHSIDNFIDDVIIFTRTFQDHLLVDEEFLQRLRTAEPYSKSKQVFHWIQQPRMFGIQSGERKAETHTGKSGNNTEFFQTNNKEASKIVSWFGGLLSEIHSQFFSCCVSIVGSDQERTTEQSRLGRVPAERLPYVKICTHGDASLKVTQHQWTVHLTDRCVEYRYRSSSSPIRE